MGDVTTIMHGVKVGPESVKHPRGWRPPDCGRNDECLRSAFSCVTGIHPLQMPWISPGQGGFWEGYRILAEVTGHRWEERVETSHSVRKRSHPWPFVPGELWIAGVNSCTPNLGHGQAHAIVMRGQELYYDPMWDIPGAGRKRRPTRICWGAAIVPVDG